MFNLFIESSFYRNKEKSLCLLLPEYPLRQRRRGSRKLLFTV